MFKKILAIFLCLISNRSQTSHFQITSIHDLLKTHQDIEYIKCHDAQPFEYRPFPISRFPELQPNKGIFAESFILKIPQGQVCSWRGWIKIDDNIISEFIPPYFSLTYQKLLLEKTKFEKIKKIKGKVAVLTMIYDSCYFHWLYNVLGRLALLEKEGIEYDYLYVSYDLPFMKETLTLWGINTTKIITPFGENKYIQADELIVPSHIDARTPQSHEYVLNWIPLEQYCKVWDVAYQTIDLPENMLDESDILSANVPLDNIFTHWTPLCNYICPWIIDYFRSKFLPIIQNKDFNFSKKIFISRQDVNARQMINEDEIFALFEPLGFKKYTLGQMSIVEQITLFRGAKSIVAAHGSALLNILFSQPNTNVIEIFQGHSDSSFYNLSQQLQLNHYCIKTMEFKGIKESQNTFVDKRIIQKFIENNQALFTNN